MKTSSSLSSFFSKVPTFKSFLTPTNHVVFSQTKRYVSVFYRKDLFNFEEELKPKRMPLGVEDPDPRFLDIHLGNLRDNPGAKKKKVRVGRGIGSGVGKTCGRGHKGQKARERVPAGFEGGQTPLYKKVRKYGFSNAMFKTEYQEVNLRQLETFILLKRVDPTKVITMKDLYDAKLFKKVKDGVKLLGNGAETWSIPINIEVSAVSKKAKEAIEKVGGSVKTVYYDKIGLRYLLKPHKFLIPPKRAQPKPKKRDRFDDWGQNENQTTTATEQTQEQ